MDVPGPVSSTGACGLRAERAALDDPRWLALVSTSPEATASHLAWWTRLVSGTYGFPAFALLLVRAGQPVAGVPLVDVSTRVRGRRYASLPFTDHCAPLGSPELLPDLARALRDLRERDRLARIEIRDALPSVAPDVVTHVSGLRHQINLPRSADEAFAAMSSGHRRDVRIAERAGLRAEIGTSPILAEAFTTLHVATRKRLGVPVQPRRFLRALGAALQAQGVGFIVVVWQSERPVAAGVFLTANNTVLFKYSASDASVWKLCPNNMLVWEAMRRCIEQEATLFDFGRSEIGQDGLCAFKRRFGAVESPLTYTSIGAEPGTRRLKPGRLSQRVIQHSPSFVGEAIGQALYRYVA